MDKRLVYSILLTIILFGGVFIISEQFMNIENTAKAYYIGLTVLLFLIICTINQNGYSALKDALYSSELIMGITMVCMSLSVYGLLQYFGLAASRSYAFPITGNYENPAGYAAIQTAIFPYALFLVFDKNQKRKILWLAGITALTCALSVMLSGSRAGLLAICAATAVIICCKTTILTVFRTYKWLWILFTLGVITVSIILYRIKADSAIGRLFIWKVGLNMIMEHPIWGYGTGGFEKHYMEAQADYFTSNPNSSFIQIADNISYPFNEFLKLTISYGFVGLTLAICFLVITIKRLLSASNEKIRVIGLAVFASVFVMCMFSYPFHYAAVWFIVAITIIPCFLKRNGKCKEWIHSKCLRASIFLFLTMLSICALRMMYLDLKWAEMSKRSLSGHTEQMLPHYKKMKKHMNNNPYFLYNYAAELNYVGRYEESLGIIEECRDKLNDYDVQILLADNLENMGLTDQAIEEYSLASNMVPCRFEPLGKIMSLSINKNDTLTAVKYALKITTKQIKVPSVRISEIIKEADKVLIEYSVDN